MAHPSSHMSNITTVAGLKTYMGVSSSTDDGILATVVPAVNAFAIGRIGYDPSSQAYPSEMHDGTGGTIMVPNNTPISAVASVIISQQSFVNLGIYLPLQAVNIPLSNGTTPGFLFDDIRVVLVGGYYFFRGRNNVILSYTAGFASVPADIVEACNECGQLLYNRIKNQNQKSNTTSGQGVVFYAKDLPEFANSVFEQYRRRMRMM
jgi:hypothetical protein